MKRIIVDYAKLTHEILNLLVDKFPDGYDDSNIIRFKNAQNELIEAVEVKTEDTIFLVKISTNLADRIENYDEDDEIANEIEPIEEDLDLDEDDDIDDGDSLDKPDFNDADESGNNEDDDDEDDTTSDNNLPDKDDEDEE